MTNEVDAAAAFNVASSLLDACATEVANGAGGPVMRRCVVPGLIAWDAVECGQLVVALTRQFLAETFPAQPGASLGSASLRSPCMLPYRVWDLLVGITRCAPPLDSQGFVSCAALNESSRIVSDDAYRVLLGSMCWLDELVRTDAIADYTIAGQPIIGPLGGGVGSELQITIAFVNGCPC